MTNARTFLRTALLATALIAAPALADGPIKDRGEAVERAQQAIIQAAGQPFEDTMMLMEAVMQDDGV